MYDHLINLSTYVCKDFLDRKKNYINVTIQDFLKLKKLHSIKTLCSFNSFLI